MDDKRRLSLHYHHQDRHQDHHHQDHHRADMNGPVRRRRRARLWLAVVVLALVGCGLWSARRGGGGAGDAVRARLGRLPDAAAVSASVSAPAPPAAGGGKVPLEAHIMSKCPDARDALRQLILPAMQQIHDKVDFKLSYIGALSQDGVECKHGPSECLGNIIELCALELYPDPKTSLGFVMCLTRNYQTIPERSLIEDCALEHAVDFDRLNACAAQDDGAHGLELLRASVQRSADLNVTISCTLRLDDEVYCIRDGGQWKDCPHGSSVSDLVRAVEGRARRS